VSSLFSFSTLSSLLYLFLISFSSLALAGDGVMSNFFLSLLFFISCTYNDGIASPFYFLSFNSLIFSLFHLSQLQCCHHVPFLLSLSTFCLSSLSSLIATTMVLCPLSNLSQLSCLSSLSHLLQLQWWCCIPSL
jgi:uncharacterized membrane protein